MWAQNPMNFDLDHSRPNTLWIFVLPLMVGVGIAHTLDRTSQFEHTVLLQAFPNIPSAAFETSNAFQFREAMAAVSERHRTWMEGW